MNMNSYHKCFLPCCTVWILLSHKTYKIFTGLILVQMRLFWFSITQLHFLIEHKIVGKYIYLYLYKEPKMSIPVFPKLWDTELLCTEYAQNYWLPQVPVDSSPGRMPVNRRWNYLAQVLFESSHRHLSVDRRWKYSARVLVDSSPRRPSVSRLWNYLARVPVVCSSTDVETVDSHPSRLSLDHRNL